jgi:hypothetical protein
LKILFVRLIYHLRARKDYDCSEKTNLNKNQFGWQPVNEINKEETNFSSKSFEEEFLDFQNLQIAIRKIL